MLEYKPTYKNDLAKVKLIRNSSEKKGSGSYYTSDAIVRSMIENTLDPLCKLKTFDEILRLKVLDPAMGSGHFLVGVINHLALEITTHPDAPPITANDTETEIAYWRKRVVENCIYGVDSNPMAVELAKLTLWLHTIAKGEPLSFLDHHIRCGNTLIGADIKDLANLPHRIKETPQISFTMEFPFTNIVSEAIGHYLVIGDLESTNADTIYRMEEELELAQKTLSYHKQIANLWLSVYFDNTVKPNDYHQFLQNLKAKSPIPLNRFEFQTAKNLAEQYNYFHWEMEFPEIFRDDKGEELDKPGFDVIVGNPPYGANLDRKERMYLKQKAQGLTNSNSAAFFIDAVIGRLLKSNGIFTFIVPKSLLYVEEWHNLVEALLEKTTHLIDVEDSFKGVKLEQVIFIYNNSQKKDKYITYKLEDETWVKRASIKYNYPKLFKTWICDVSQEEIDIGFKIYQIGKYLNDISETKRGLNYQRHLSDSDDIPMFGGNNVQRYALDGIKGFISKDILDESKVKEQFLKQPKVISQKIVAFIRNPNPHIKIQSTVDHTGDIFTLDTVMNTILTNQNFTLEFITGILNSTLINWYIHKFIFASAIRTMTFDQYYVGKIPIPDITVNDQRPIKKLVNEIISLKQEKPDNNISNKIVKIDDIIYSLYGITESEKVIINRINQSIGEKY